MRLCLFNLNRFTYYLHSKTKHMVDIFGMTLEAISRPFNIESLKLFQFCCFSLSYCLIWILLCRYYLKCYLCYVAFKKSLRIFPVTLRSFKVILRPIKNYLCHCVGFPFSNCLEIALMLLFSGII